MSRIIIMKKIAIVIPSRLEAARLPNKPLKLIGGKEMILHVHDLALETQVEEVIVATPDKEIADVIKNHGGKAVITKNNHNTGTDRVYEVFEKLLKNKIEIIINLQGDMPNLDPRAINHLSNYMEKNSCDIATLASNIHKEEELDDENICKAVTNDDIKKCNFSRAIDFYRKKESTSNDFIYHHIGIYAFTSEALIRYVNLNRSKLEIERNLEQLRALENDMKIDLGYVNTFPLSVDTKEDLKKIRNIMENK
jgi:3-deoxy-manno-octulosonate cytidylyltransferase (CMP-KDO synthetase)